MISQLEKSTAEIFAKEFNLLRILCYGKKMGYHDKEHLWKVLSEMSDISREQTYSLLTLFLLLD